MIEGTEWRVVVVAGEAAADGVVTTIRFDGGHAAGRGGVNRYRGNYTLTGEELEIGPVMSTMMAGPEPAMRQEARWFVALASPAVVWLDDGELVLDHADGTTSRLRAL